ncbi:MAG: mannonate dehydratase, partial [Aquirufa sp.]
MIHTMRWFGPNDPVSLMDIRQAGCTGVVTALHQIPVGEVWPIESIQERISIIEAGNKDWTPLHWSVVESLPVHEGIKKALPSRAQLIENYKTSLRNLAACGIKTVCYNFMPVLDWSRTKLNFEMPDEARALRFVWTDFAVFDLHILQRPGAAADYTQAVQEASAQRFASMSSEEKEELKNTALLGLPGSEEAFHLENFQSLLDEYRDISADQLRENLHYFVRSIAPLAQELGINLCIHPDDPPFPLLGLPRVVSTEADLAALMEASPERANGITFCTGSLGVRADNDLPGMVRRFADRIHFLHLRATFREQNDPLIFHEAPHLTGDVDMFEVVKAVVEEEKRRGGEEIPMRPDHGHQMLDDLKKKTYPGYSAIGRLRGLAEIRGLELAIRSFLAMFLVVCSFALKADDGYRLWLKFDKVASAARYAPYASSVSSEFASTPILETARKELANGLKGLTGVAPRAISENGSIQFVKDATIPAEGFEIQVDKKVQVKVEGLSVVGRKYIRIKASSDRGILYGVFELLRMIQQEKPLANISSSPKVKFRMLNHWDNVMGTIERGYAGQSLWKWYELPETVDPRYTDYARANAAIGINAVSVNNVNASARFLTPEYLAKVKALADVFRPYGIKLFLSVNFASPKILGRLKTSDPLDPEVRAWWAAKTKEVYSYVPDFGGFLVKANSEGEPGPQEYGRTHADGANMLAEAVKPFNGLVIWRAFVYAPNPKGDRFKEAYNDFKPLDGTFAKNVIVQVK